MEAGKRTINDIFNGNKVLEIPFFQRSYVWDTPQWERFLADMISVSANNKPYFLGSVILKQQMTSSQTSVGDRRTLIDGQQRLTTLNIFFKVLSLKSGNDYLSNLFRLPMMEGKIALLHNHNDVEAFNRIMDLKELSDLEETDGVTSAYRYFKDFLDISKINSQNILTNIMFVGIDLNADDDEQQIFDTINSLGVKLTTAELLKNYLFGRNELKLYKEYWQNVFEADQETKEYWDTDLYAGRLERSFIDLFFYSFLQIKIQDQNLNVKAEDKIEFTKVVGLFDSYKRFIHDYKIDKLSLIKEIKEYAILFQDNFDLSVINRALPSHFGVERINAIIWGLENTTLIPYVLFVLKNVDKEADRNYLFEYLEAYIMRRMVCHANTKNYNQLFSERLISNKVISQEALKSFIDERSDKVNYMPTDEEVKEGFHSSKLINNQAAGILYFIESKIRNSAKHSTALLGFDSYSLEHLMPKKWENNWPAVTNENDRIERNRKLLTLGNLTIITASLNSSIRDGNWQTKKNGKGYKGGLNQYASGLDTLNEYLGMPDWDEQMIEHRAEFLANQATTIWKS